MSTGKRLSIHQLSLYNTGRSSPEQIVAAFAARQQQFDRVLADIAAEKPRSRAQHHLIVGQRGMGKTMLLARLAAELRLDPELSKQFIPLVFAEEQYAVDRLSKFWLNCLDSLADARELSKDAAAVRAIDATVARLTATPSKAPKDDQPFADEAYEAFAAAAKVSGQRPVLLVDNLQLVFERLEPGQQHSLRELLMRPGSPILVGASPIPPPQSQDYGAAFYDQFKVHYLRPLDEAEMRALLVHLADAAERPDVRERVLQHPARLTVLRQLTGGNPRTTLTLFFLYAEDFAPSVFGDLEGLLDRVTPLYKARFEELTQQQQVVASAVANHWDPVTAATLVERTGLPAGTISSQLDRMEKLGFIERTELFGETRTGYQLAERFFNIWFLMRSASRRQRREVEFLTRFLENFYEPADRSRLARQLMLEERFSPDRYVLSQAVAATLSEREMAEELTRHADLAALHNYGREPRARLRDLIDFDSLPPATQAFDEIRKKLIALVPEDAGIEPEEFAKAVLGDRAMFTNNERERLAGRSEKLNAGEIATVLETIRDARAADEERFTPAAVEWFSQRLSSGQIRKLRDADDWNRAFRQAPDREAIQLILETFPPGGTGLSDAAVATIIEALQPHESSGAEAWQEWGFTLSVKLARDAEGEIAFRAAIAHDGGSARAWSGLGDVLRRLHRVDEAEAAYRMAINLKPEHAVAWRELGDVLVTLQRLDEAEHAYRMAIGSNATDPTPHIQLGYLLRHAGRYEEAAAAYRAAIDLSPGVAWRWIELADLLHYELDHREEAESAYRTAIQVDPAFTFARRGLANLLIRWKRYDEAEVTLRTILKGDTRDAELWAALGHVLQEGRKDFVEAEAAYRTAIEVDPESPSPWHALGNLQSHLGRFDESEVSYRTAIRLDAEFRWAWIGLANLLSMHMEQPYEAAVAYRHAISLDPKDARAWRGLGQLLHDPFKRFEESEHALRTAIELEPDAPGAWNSLGNLYCDHMGRLDEAEQAFVHAARIAPSARVVQHNLLFLRRDYKGEGASARPILDGLQKLPTDDGADTMLLQEALFAAYDFNWGLAREALVKALDLRADGFKHVTVDDWLRATAVLLHLNYGAELLALVNERGDGGRLRPWVEAVRALVAGDRRVLQNVAPEVRTTAEVLYDGIERRLNKLPEKTRRRPVPAAKKERRSRMKRR